MKVKLIQNNETVRIKTGSEAGAVKVHMAVAPPKLDIYEGVYDVTPLPDSALELQTEHKLKERNVVVAQIPYYETHNESGTTVYIGE